MLLEPLPTKNGLVITTADGINLASPILYYTTIVPKVLAGKVMQDFYRNTKSRNKHIV